MVELEGWKRIATYLGRDESTVKRWEATRSLPIRRLQGDPRSPVYALADELDRWRQQAAERPRDIDKMLPPQPVAQVPVPRSGNRWLKGLRPRHVAAAVAIAACGLAGVALTGKPEKVVAPAIDPKAQEYYLEGQFALEQRSSASLAQAAEDFSKATAIDPRFAAAYSGLADYWILAREYDAPTAFVAYPRAEAAARAALAIDPNDLGAHRALGLIDYWWHRNAKAARQEFATAMTLAPNDARSHHWFANVLDDAGDSDAAIAQIERASLVAQFTRD